MYSLITQAKLRVWLYTRNEVAECDFPLFGYIKEHRNL